MSRRSLRIAACLLLAALASAARPAAAYKVAQTIAVGGEGGWDYLVVDAAARRLYVTRGTRVMVFDADTLARVGEIPDTAGVHGVALAPELHRGFTSNGRAGTVTVFDPATLKTLSTVKVTGQNPDAILYEPRSKQVFTFNGRSGDATALDAESGKVRATIPLGGKPEFAVADPEGLVYVNIEDKSEMVVFDAARASVLHRWPLAPCEEPSGLAIDTKAKRLFAGCSNKMMAVVDATTGKVVATPPIGSGVDANAFDAARSLAFSSNGDGTLTVVGAESPDRYAVLQNVATLRGARTMALDSKTGRIFLVTADYGPPPSPTAEQPRPRPSMVPDSFKLLVIAPQP